MQFDLIITNPPFQNSTTRGKTPHKVWIEFTRRSMSDLLATDGLLCQVSPSSFQSPSNSVLRLFQTHRVDLIDVSIGRHFPNVGSTFSYYLMWKTAKSATDGRATTFRTTTGEFSTEIDDSTFYIPNDACAESLSIHRKVMFGSRSKLAVQRDYVTCHNIRLRRDDTLSKTKSDRHVFPVFHTNNQIWWSTLRQPFADEKKVMWTRSGFTKPFYDDGRLGCTDMGYYVLVADEAAGLALADNLSRKLFRYVFQTARWSGFGNEKVFDALPDVANLPPMDDDALFDHFEITRREREFIERSLGPRARTPRT